MRRFRWVILLMLIPAVLLGAALLPARYDETFLGALRDKVDLLARPSEKPRVVVIGGSGVAFGQNSDMLERLLPGYQVVNLGMCAGLGTAVMLDLAKPDLRPGDVVVFAPEISGQTLSMFFHADSMWQAADGRMDLLLRLRKEDRASVLGAWADFAARKAAGLWEGKPALEGVYRREALNPWGDVAAERPGNTMPGGWDGNQPVAFETDLVSADLAAYVRDFAADCRQRNVVFLYRFAPVNALAVQGGDIDELAAFLADALDCPILGEPSDAVMDAGWFYDTNYHLNTAGAIVNTARLARELAAFLALPEPEEIPLPEMPPMVVAAAVPGEDGDAECFTWVEENGAIRLTGLTDVGAARTEITLPSTICGKPVTAFDKQVFAGNQRIRRIVLQQNIAAIADDSFAGCTALEKITLRHQDPAKCPVGEGLLRGTQAVVAVHGERWSAYVTNYFWAVHGGRLVAENAASVATAAPTAAPAPNIETVCYHGNGGTRPDGSETLRLPVERAHLRMNTAPGSRYFTREGYLLTDWNTAADGSGEAVGLGHRLERRDDMTFYAQWTKTNDPADFTWVTERGEAYITGYKGFSREVVIPMMLGDAKVTRIRRDAFAGADVDRVILPPTLFSVDRGAFTGSALQEIILYDTLYYIHDESFAGCENLTTLTIHAATPPVWSGTYFDTFPDKFDWLRSLKGQRKIVLFSGSSGRFGYDSAAIHAAFPAYQVANMGVYAYTNALPQLDLIEDLMEAGDILLSAPEFDTPNNQFCTTNALDAHFFAMMEGNYAMVENLDLRRYTGVFDALGQFLTTRSAMSAGSYAVSAKGYDDDYNAYPFDTYNQYGDLILPRPGSERDELLQHGLADYTVAAFPAEVIHTLNAAYHLFLQKGVTVYFTYTPRNWSSLTEDSTPENRAALHAHLKAHLAVPVISEIEDSLLPGNYFYLIDSHLSTEGVAIRTERIIRDLRRVLGQ